MKLALYKFFLLMVGASTLFAADTKDSKDTKALPDAKAGTTSAPSAKPVASPVYQVELKAYRWRKHPHKNYERLVLEFIRKDKGTSKASNPSVVPAASGKEAMIVVNGVTLVGEANESKVSETYESKSTFMGPLSILADGAGGGFNLKIGLKNSSVVVI